MKDYTVQWLEHVPPSPQKKRTMQNFEKKDFLYTWGGKGQTELPRQRWEAKNLNVEMSEAPKR
jgi:hypothetical protein